MSRMDGKKTHNTYCIVKVWSIPWRGYKKTVYTILWYILTAYSLAYVTINATPRFRLIKRGWCVYFETSALEYRLGEERDSDDYMDYVIVDVSYFTAHIDSSNKCKQRTKSSPRIEHFQLDVILCTRFFVSTLLIGRTHSTAAAANIDMPT